MTCSSTEVGILSLLANVTSAIQEEGEVLPMAEGGWYEGGPEGYRVNPDKPGSGFPAGA